MNAQYTKNTKNTQIKRITSLKNPLEFSVFLVSLILMKKIETINKVRLPDKHKLKMGEIINGNKNHV